MGLESNAGWASFGREGLSPVDKELMGTIHFRNGPGPVKIVAGVGFPGQGEQRRDAVLECDDGIWPRASDKLRWDCGPLRAAVSMGAPRMTRPNPGTGPQDRWPLAAEDNPNRITTLRQFGRDLQRARNLPPRIPQPASGPSH